MSSSFDHDMMAGAGDCWHDVRRAAEGAGRILHARGAWSRRRWRSCRGPQGARRRPGLRGWRLARRRRAQRWPAARADGHRHRPGSGRRRARDRRCRRATVTWRMAPRIAGRFDCVVGNPPWGAGRVGHVRRGAESVSALCRRGGRASRRRAGGCACWCRRRGSRSRRTRRRGGGCARRRRSSGSCTSATCSRACTSPAALADRAARAGRGGARAADRGDAARPGDAGELDARRPAARSTRG